MSTMRRIGWAGLCGVMAGVLLAGAGMGVGHAQATPGTTTQGTSTQGTGQQETPPPTPELRRRQDSDIATLSATARLVVLDVVVTDGKNHPVTGLKQSDFTLYEDGAAQKITSFVERGPAPGGTVAGRKLPPNVFTNLSPAPSGSASTIILMDALDTNVQAQMYLRAQVIDYMKTVQPGTEMAIFQLDTSLHMIQGLTADPALLQAAVNGKRYQPTLTPLTSHDPAGLGRMMKQQIMMNGLETLANYLSVFPGRKNLIWFTGSVPINFMGPTVDNPFPDTWDSIGQAEQMTSVLKLSQVAVYPIDARGLRTDPKFSAASRGVPSVTSVNDFGTRTALQNGYLDQVAEDTGGKAFYNTNGLKDVIGEVVDTGSHYYTLSYAPSNRELDGKFRKLKVNLEEAGYHL
jgi:VWFA-related protein